MAAIQTIRKWGVALLVVIGLGLFAFIAEDFFRVFDTLFGADKRHVGQVYSEKLAINDYQSMIDEYTEAIKFTRGTSSLSDQEQDQLKDQVWQTFVNNKLIEHECDKLGLTVTDAELNNVIQAGTNPLLMQTPFVNKQTGRFDATMLKQFLEQYNQMQAKPDQVPQQYMEYYQNLYKFWGFVEKTLRSTLLNDKYQALVGRGILSNPVSARLAYKGIASQSNAVIASVPYTSIPDNQVKVSDEDISKLYARYKEMFRQFNESRDIKYISFQVKASPADKAALQKEMNEYATEMGKGNDNLVSTVTQSSSLIPYSGLAVSKTAFPNDIQSKLDSVSTGVVTGPYYNASDNTLNIIKLVSTTEAPDSVEYRAINCANAAGIDAAKATADSIVKAVNGGAKLENIAKKLGQNTQTTWLTANQYEGGQVDADNATFIKALVSAASGSVQKIELAQNVVVVEVVSRGALKKKYDAAVIKRTVDFSKDTYTREYNKFSHFIATNKTFARMEANAAKSGYVVQERKDQFSNEHNIAGIPSTKDALRWLFGDAKVGDLSKLYECGNNDDLLIMYVTGKHKIGYRPESDPEVKKVLTQIALRDKKAEKLMAQLKGKTVEQALAMPAATQDTLNGVIASNPGYIASTGAAEPALVGGICYGAQGKNYGPVKGNNGVYVFRITGRKATNEKFNLHQYEQSVAESYYRNVGQYANDLYVKGKVKDRRYLYF
jgi:peptidyl-prolyl cis-trans isomerase D